MKKLIAAALVLLCILSMVGCDNRSMDKDLNKEAGTITFYSEPIKEAQNSVTPIAGQIRVELDEEQANRISAIIDNVDEWVDDHAVNRLAYYFDGEFEFADSEFAYYFTYEYNVIYYDHYFAEITDEEMQIIKDTKIAITNEELQQKFPEYYGLNTAKGLEVYVWQTAEDTYYCGVLSGTNRVKTPEEISGLAANGATVEEMKIILSSCDISDESISILPCKQSISDYAYQIDDAYIQKITELFGK